MQKQHGITKIGGAITGLLFCVAVFAQQGQPPPLPIEPTGRVESLPSVYPEHWFLVHDAAFFHMSDGKVYVLDTDADTLPSQVKGTFNVSLMGNIAQSSKRGEIYASETFHSRGTRGDRLDVITIWDSATLGVSGEVILPGEKRFMGMPQRYAMLVMNNDRWLAVANFSPATSVTLIDLDRREIIAEIPTPGCSLIYPTGDLGFSSLCADGRFLSTELKSDGGIVRQTRTDAFFSSDDTPIFERPAIVGNTAYFPSLAGLIYPVRIDGKIANVGEPWQLVPAAERTEKWAPSGIAIIDRDDLGRIYVLMHSGATNGSHNGGGSEVWVFDAAKQARIMRIALKEWGLSIAVSRGKQPLLMVTNPVTMALEMYSALSGDYVKTITDFGQETPLMMHGAQ